MRLGSLLTACLVPATALAATNFETFNPLLRYRPSGQQARSEASDFTKRQTQSSSFLNSNTTSTFTGACSLVSRLNAHPSQSSS